MKNYTLMSVLSILFVSTAYAQGLSKSASGGGINGSESARIKSEVGQYLKIVAAKIDQLNPDQYADGFRCPFNGETQEIGHLVGREEAKKIILGIQVDVNETEGASTVDGQKADLLIQRVADLASGRIVERMIIKRDAYLQIENNKQQTLVVTGLIFQAVCRDHLENKITQAEVARLVAYLNQVQ